MITKNVYPGGTTFYRVTYKLGMYEFFLDFARKKCDLIFVAGAYYNWMIKDAINRIYDFEKYKSVQAS